jgi:hypothetical protein
MWKAIPKLSGMETDDSRDAMVQQLREIEWGQAAPWVSYPPMQWWWAMAFGVWTGTYTLTMGLLDGITQGAVQLLHLLLMLAAVWWMRRVRGTYPTGRSPRELRGSFVLLFGGAVLVALAIWGCYALMGSWVAAGIGVVLAWGLVAAYERTYARASARVRERLA